MKKHNLKYRTKFKMPIVQWLLLSALLALASAANAQLSGTYTIGSGGSYATFKDALKDLSSKGVNGPVTFQVSAATFAESVDIHKVKGASKTNSITFSGKGRGKSIIANTGNVVTLDTCYNITFTGFSIISTKQGEAVYANRCHSCSVQYCDVTGQNNANDVLRDYYTDSFSVSNCRVSGGGSIDIYIQSTYAAGYGYGVYKNNKITGYGTYGIYAYAASYYQYTGNVIDTPTLSLTGIGLASNYETGSRYYNNQVLAYQTTGMTFSGMNYYNASVQFQFVNNVVVHGQGANTLSLYQSSNVLIAHNTIASVTDYGLNISASYAGTNISIMSNSFATYSGIAAMNLNYSGTVPYPVPFAVIDGNNFSNTRGSMLVNNTISGVSTNYYDIAKYQKAMSVYRYTNPYNGLQGRFERYSTAGSPVFSNPGNNDFHVNQSYAQPSGVYAGIDADMDGDSRCKYFPTAGADESTYGGSKPSVKMYLPAAIYPGSPTFIYQSGKAGEAKAYAWYVNGVMVSDSVVLKTSAFVTGTNTLKLVTKSCYGNDSASQTISVSAPKSAPNANFISSKNTIRSADTVSFQDASTLGPTTWQWRIVPDSVMINGSRFAAIKYTYGSVRSQNLDVQFLYPGNYNVCLKAGNGAGNGAENCKTAYIKVLPTLNLSNTPQTVHDPEGTLYDNGGPTSAYSSSSNSNRIQSVVIDPCADSVYLTLSQFDMYCGYDYLRIYEGSSNAGRLLSSSKCTSTGYINNGPGYTGGVSTGTCTYTCLPNLGDTFKAKGKMYVEMVCYYGTFGAGFAAHWWSKPRKAPKATAAFTTSNSGDSVCAGTKLIFTNTTKYDPTDQPTYLWDLDDNISDGFECVGACNSISYPFYLPGDAKVTLIATNCGGSDTLTRTIHVYNPPKPKAVFAADNTTPTASDIVFFTSKVKECVETYKWVITPSAGTTGTALFVNGTNGYIDNPQVTFTGTGYYDVKLEVENGGGLQKDSVTLTKYILVRDPYCVPIVQTLNKEIGISSISLNTLSNKVSQASASYTDYTKVQGKSTTLAIGVSYPVSIGRDPSMTSENINRTVYIDWNRDGSFDGPGEKVVSDSNSASVTYQGKITVPRSVSAGATVMRVAVNWGSLPNRSCGINNFGEFQDYRIYVVPYNIPSVVSLKGRQGLKDTIFIEQGYAYTDSGYAALSQLYGDLTSQVVRSSRRLGSTNVNDTFSNLVPNTYIFTYNVSDSSGNKAIPKYRVVKVTRDKTPPVLIVAGPDTTLLEVTKTQMRPLPLPVIKSADDMVDGSVIKNTVTDTGGLRTNILGKYIIKYSVTDLSNNTATVLRVIKVIDTLKPVMILNGRNTDTVSVHSRYNDAGVSVSDNYYPAAALVSQVHKISDLDTAKTGVYTIEYQLSDPSGNTAPMVKRTVVVADTDAPAITLLGAPEDSVEVYMEYHDPGVTVSDNYDAVNTLSITSAGSYYTAFPAGKKPSETGTYTILYTARDKAGNISTAKRIVKVQDRTAPVIKLTGQFTVSVCRWFDYKDAGYTVTDNYDKPGDIRIDTIITGNTQVSNLFSVRYMGTDRAGNSAYSDFRYVMVKDASDPTCASGIVPGKGLEQYIQVYPNPNNGIFTITASLPDQQQVRISVCDITGREVSAIYDGMLQQNRIVADMSAQPAGMYLINIVSAREKIVARVELVK